MKKKMPKIVRELEAAGHKVTDLSKQGVKSIGVLGCMPAAAGTQIHEEHEDRPQPNPNRKPH